MQQIIEKYQKKIERLNVFEQQTLRTLLAETTSNGMSRFYIVFGDKTVVDVTTKRVLDKS